MKTLAELDYDELHARAAAAARLPDLDDDGEDYAGLDVLDGEVRSSYGDVAVTSDAWLRQRANVYLAGLPDAPRPIDALRRLDDEALEFVLSVTLYEIDLENGHLRAFDPLKHKRWLKPHPKAGQFRPMIDLLKAAIAAFDPKKDKHPFELFKRPQLLKAARDRGIVLKRGESDDSIADKLLADLGGPAKAKPATQPSASGVTTKRGPKWHTGDTTTEVHLGGDQLGIVVHSAMSGGFFPFVPAGSKKTPLGNRVRVKPGAGSGYQTEQDAVDAIVRAYTPSKVSGPGLAGLDLTELRIDPTAHTSGHLSKTSLEVSQGGSPIGTVHDFGYGWEARDANGKKVTTASAINYKTKSEAIQALAAVPNSGSAPASNKAGFKLDPADRLRVKLLPFSGGPWIGKKDSLQVRVGHSQIGAVHQEQDDTWTAKPLGPGEPFFVAPKKANRDQAIKALLDAHDAAAGGSSSSSQASTPSANPTVSSDPAINAALDVLYGRDPKSKTAARQMVVYGALRQHQFDQLDPAERSVLLGDLSYIMTTSKNASTVGRAQTLFGRFTPAGTPFGHVPAQMTTVPNLATGPGQTRFPDPDGVKGMLKKAINPGTSGDGWTRLANGQTGPWGKYGASGLLLRHVDKNGQERYLMVQRGPAISDPGKWQFPGGAIDSNETMAEGATREVVEELGFNYSDFADAGVHGYHESTVPGAGSWKYTSFAATVPTRLKPDLSTHHAQMETSDAKWMTLDEIRKLDSGGKLLKPLQGGALERNVVSLFPAKGAGPGVAVSGSGPALTKPARLQGGPRPFSAPTLAPAPPAPHKRSTGKNLITDKAAQDKLRADVAAVRKSYRGKTADERLAAIGAMQGYDATPTIATKAEMDLLLASGKYIEVWRGVTGKGGKSAKDINESMRSGTAYYGLGVFGNGYYLATDKAIAQRYADGSRDSLLRVLIPKAAKTRNHKDIVNKARSATSSTSYYQQGRQSLGGGTLHDEGRYGAAEGLDGIEISKQDYQFKGGYGHLATGPVYNWVNRSVLIIQEAQ